MEIVMSIKEKIAEFLVLSVGTQAGYLIDYNTNLGTLRSEVESLGAIKSRVQRLVDAATRKGEVIEDDVNEWLTAVNGINEEVERFFEDEVEEDRRCPDLISRYSLSRKAAKKTLLVIRLQREGSKLLERVSSPAPPPGIEHTATGGFVDFQSRKSVMDDIMAALKDDKVNAIGICGLGGTGKTTTAREVGKRAKAEKLFEVIVMATVTRTPDLKGIQDEIAEFFGLKWEEKSLSGRARRLRARLMGLKSVLVILDDVWETLNVEELGIPLGGDHKGCKVLITSRSQDVCKEMRTYQNFTIDVLSEEEAWNLFKEMAGNCIDSPDLNPIAQKVLNECGLLPIAIITVGSALREKGKHRWKDALLQLRLASPENVSPTVAAKVYRSLELSYNFLETQEEKSCLLLCCIFKEDTNIRVEDLVGYMMRLGILNGFDAGEEARDRVHTLVDKLASCYLLLEGDDQEHQCVKVHDVIRDVIRWVVIGKQSTSTSLISYSAPPLGIESITGTGGYVDFESRSSSLNYIMRILMDDNFSLIGIQGPGGVGKTTLVKQVFKRAKVDKLFDMIVMATVSQTPDLEEIQEEIADNLGFKFNEQGLLGRAATLRARLMDCKTVLVILDDVWARLDLEAMGIPFGGDHKGCKVILTTRSYDVCDMMSAQSCFSIALLTDAESWKLFKEVVGDKDKIESPDLLHIAREVVKACWGSPMLIFIVGGALENKNKHIWNDMLLQLRKFDTGHSDYRSKAYQGTVMSYNLLESREAKSCLLLCSLFKEDTNIPVEQLVRYGMRLGLFEGIVAVEQARAQVHTLVHKLKRCYLLLDGDKKDTVKMHDMVLDVIRDMVRNCGSGQQMVECLNT